MAAMSSPCVCTVQDDESVGQSSGAQLDRGQMLQRRRHSFFLPRRKSIVGHIMETEEGLLLKVDLFLSELERRLDFIENYGDLTLDSSISRAFSTLQAVRARCSQASEEVLGEGRRRLHLMVETLEARYQEGLASAESLNEKARLGIELLDGMLSDFEGRAYKFREDGFAGAADAAGAIMSEGRRVVDESMHRAREVVDEGIERAKRAAMSLEEKIEYAVGRARETGLIVYDDLPVPWRVNPHIRKGYRFTESKIECITSAFGLSNELFNIWSHAIGLVIVLAYTAFYCDPVSRWSYMVSTAALGIIGVILPWHPTFNKANMAWARVAFFVGLGATGFLPILQLWYSHGRDFVVEFYSPIGKSIMVYLVGAIVYASQIPERWWPGCFDYIGGSHNLWHLAVLGGILFHYSAMQAFFEGAFRRAELECSVY
ncbi:hypothetical protein HYQ45_005401 [Verticillium longisporum]|uniref:Uncharacterized protein n=1 Tax=Verticillium longisporum TaxID=100787 RepID=A0A8I3ATK0_VERLO|nr:hypothetical protein HYQ45_005401 [Verticillium longisporum]